MHVIILFCLLLLIGFGAMALLLRSTSPESDVDRHMKSIGFMYTVDMEGTTILKRQSLSSVPWLNNLLVRFAIFQKLRVFISQAGMQWEVSTLVVGSLVAAFAVTWLGIMFLPNLTMAIAAGLVGGFVPYGYLLAKRANRFARFDALLPEAIDLMSRALKAGHAVFSCIEMVAAEVAEPVASEFRILFEEQNLGLPLREAILNLVQRVPLENVRFLATAILVQKETGGNLAQVLDKTAAVMRDRTRLKGQLRIFTAQGRITGWVLSIMPFVVFGAIYLVDPTYESMLWTEPLGRHLAVGALVMMALGVLVIRKIVNVKV